jgi:hypothetical protein
LRVVDERVLKRIFGLERDEMAEGQRQVHTEEFHTLYTSPNILIKSRM